MNMFTKWVTRLNSDLKAVKLQIYKEVLMEQFLLLDLSFLPQVKVLGEESAVTKCHRSIQNAIEPLEYTKYNVSSHSSHSPKGNLIDPITFTLYSYHKIISSFQLSSCTFTYTRFECSFPYSQGIVMGEIANLPRLIKTVVI